MQRVQKLAIYCKIITCTKETVITSVCRILSVREQDYAKFASHFHEVFYHGKWIFW